MTFRILVGLLALFGSITGAALAIEEEKWQIWLCASFFFSVAGLKNFREISDKVNTGKGTLSLLLNDPKLYQDARAAFGDVRKALDQVNHALEDFREQAPIATFGGIIFGGL